MAMFEVDADSGFSISERKKRMKMPVGMVDEVKWPEISKDRKRSSPSEMKKRMKMPVGPKPPVKWPEISKDRKRTSPSEKKKPLVIVQAVHHPSVDQQDTVVHVFSVSTLKVGK